MRKLRNQTVAARTALFATTALTALAMTSPALADDFVGLGTLGGTFSNANGVSADGSTVIGWGAIAGNAGIHAFRWSGGVMTDLGTLGGTSSSATGVSGDGSVVVGRSNLAGDTSFRAFRWSGGVMTDLGTFAIGADSFAFGVSADGSTVVGMGHDATLSTFHAFRWTQGSGMVDLGTIGGTFSAARAASADGSVVVGESQFAGNSIQSHAFRWTASSGVMTDLGTLGSTYSYATGVSGDGSVVVGSSGIAHDGTAHAFRWSGGVMTDLGTLGDWSAATAVSTDGSVVVGRSSPAPGTVAAFRWKAGYGMQSIQYLLALGRVNTTGWNLTNATGVSADGSVIVGIGTNPLGQEEAWLVRCMTGCDFITPRIAAQSFAGQAALGQTANAAISGSLGSMNEYATQARNTQGARATPFSVFGYGAYDSDPIASGLLGMTVDLPYGLIVGATIGYNAITTNMVFNGSAKFSGGAAGAFIARAPEAGLQWLVGIGGSAIDGDVTRGYLNGNDPAFSRGSTNGRGGGALARMGWAFNDLLPNTQLTPFASYTVASSSFDGYAETGGPFPAQFGAFTSTAETARIGADARYTFKPGTWVWGTAAWAHRLDGGKSPDISGTLIGLFSMTAPGISSAKHWAELTGGVRLPAWTNGAITASVTTSLVSNQTTTYVSRLGVTQAF